MRAAPNAATARFEHASRAGSERGFDDAPSPAQIGRDHRDVAREFVGAARLD